MKLEHAPGCRERSTLAGLKRAESSPLRFFRSGQGGASIVTATGKLPASDAEALEIINRNLPGDPLSAEDVHVHYLEAASDRFIPDRYMFLDGSTLRNIADGADEGFAFMNSHRTGDIFTSSELPFGRAFVGRLETIREASGATVKRVVLGIYMLRGQHPNGTANPSTDAISAAIRGGTIFDVSMGLGGGKRPCDVCGVDLFEMTADGWDYVCKHVPGTTRMMTPKQIAEQKARGIPGGAASYTLRDAHPNEVSAVYAGAVPGAGFRKATSLARRGQLSDSDVDALAAAYDHISIPASMLHSKSDTRRRELAGATRLARGGVDEYRPAPTHNHPDYGSAEDLEQLRRATRLAMGDRAEDAPRDEDHAELRRAVRLQAGLDDPKPRPDQGGGDDLSELARSVRQIAGL